ncbi:hypothetical protein PMAYCL1PPCAC_05947, partial [Pristionchus mayeri]
DNHLKKGDVVVGAVKLRVNVDCLQFDHLLGRNSLVALVENARLHSVVGHLSASADIPTGSENPLGCDH